MNKDAYFTLKWKQMPVINNIIARRRTNSLMIKSVREAETFQIIILIEITVA